MYLPTVKPLQGIYLRRKKISAKTRLWWISVHVYGTVLRTPGGDRNLWRKTLCRPSPYPLCQLKHVTPPPVSLISYVKLKISRQPPPPRSTQDITWSFQVSQRVLHTFTRKKKIRQYICIYHLMSIPFDLFYFRHYLSFTFLTIRCFFSWPFVPFNVSSIIVVTLGVYYFNLLLVNLKILPPSHWWLNMNEWAAASRNCLCCINK
jgi:hypothetical protein